MPLARSTTFRVSSLSESADFSFSNSNRCRSFSCSSATDFCNSRVRSATRISSWSRAGAGHHGGKEQEKERIGKETLQQKSRDERNRHEHERHPIAANRFHL